MFKLIKWLIFIAIVTGLVLWFTDLPVKGKTFKEHVNEFKKTTLYQEGIKDMRALVGESFKAIGTEISGEVTDEERKELESLIKKNMASTPAATPQGSSAPQAATTTTTTTTTTTQPKGATQWQQKTLAPQPKNLQNPQKPQSPQSTPPAKSAPAQ